MLFQKSTGAADWILVGLGNPGKKYSGTRHNAGFDAIDHLAEKWSAQNFRSGFSGSWAKAEAAGQKVILLKPETFMNLSGQSVQEAASFYKIDPAHIIILCDDIAQAPGKIRIRPSGSAGGHNGLKDIFARMGSQDIPRIRLGVGEKPCPEYDLAAWVLGKLDGDNRKAFESRLDDVAGAAELIMQRRLSEAQNRYNH